MLIVLPEWYSKAREKLDACVDDIIRKNNIDWGFAHDSKTIEDAKEAIISRLNTIWEKVDVENRVRTEEFEKDMKKIIRKENKKKNGK